MFVQQLTIFVKESERRKNQFWDMPWCWKAYWAASLSGWSYLLPYLL